MRKIVYNEVKEEVDRVCNEKNYITISRAYKISNMKCNCCKKKIDMIEYKFIKNKLQYTCIDCVEDIS